MTWFNKILGYYLALPLWLRVVIVVSIPGGLVWWLLFRKKK